MNRNPDRNDDDRFYTVTMNHSSSHHRHQDQTPYHRQHQLLPYQSNAELYSQYKSSPSFSTTDDNNEQQLPTVMTTARNVMPLKPRPNMTAPPPPLHVRTQHWPQHSLNDYNDNNNDNNDDNVEYPNSLNYRMALPASSSLSSAMYSDSPSMNSENLPMLNSTLDTFVEESARTANNRAGWEGNDIEMGIVFGVVACGILVNILVLMSMCRYVRSHSMIGHFLISLAVSDLIIALAICSPFIWAAHAGTRQPFGVWTSVTCRVVCYFQFAMFTVQVYSVAWLSVDRYLAVRKPQRYESIQTKIRCQCWVIFTWLTAVFLCSPMLFSGYGRIPSIDQEAHFIYDGTIKMCSISAATSSVYATTLFVLVLVPSLLTMGYCFYNIALEMQSIKKDVDETNGQKTMASENLRNPEHKIAFLIPAMAVFAWLPWTCHELYLAISGGGAAAAGGRRGGGGGSVSNPYVQFGLTWFAISACCWRFVVYVAINRRFRKALCRGFLFCCLKCRCCRKADEEIGILD